MKKTITILLAMAMVTSLSATSWASTTTSVDTETQQIEGFSPRFVILNRFYTNIKKSGSSQVECSAYVDVTQSCSKELTLTLQKMQNGSWVNVKTWKINHNGSSRTTVTKSYQVASNTKHRTMASIVVKDSNGRVLDHATTYSASV